MQASNTFDLASPREIRAQMRPILPSCSSCTRDA
jgi:hypothetical protein